VLTATRLANNTAATATTQNFTSTISPSILTWGVVGAPATAANRFLYPGTIPVASIGTTEPITQFAVPQPCTIKSLRVLAGTAPGAGHTSVFTLRKGGASQSLTVTLAGAAGFSGSDLIHAVPYTGGDTVSMLLTADAATNAIANFSVTAEVY
jgi:hypothetical protein